MRWTFGADVMSDIIQVLLEEISEENKRYNIYEQLINIFDNYDCNELQECIGFDSSFDLALQKITGISKTREEHLYGQSLNEDSLFDIDDDEDISGC